MRLQALLFVPPLYDHASHIEWGSQLQPDALQPATRHATARKHTHPASYLPARLHLRLNLRWSSQLTTHSLGAIIDPGEAALRQETFVMHEQATTLKHYLKVVPQRKVAVDGQVKS